MSPGLPHRQAGYAIKVIVVGRQVREAVATHEGNNQRIVGEQAVLTAQLGGLHDREAIGHQQLQRKGMKLFSSILKLRQLGDAIRMALQPCNSAPGQAELFLCLGRHDAMDRIRKTRRSRSPGDF